MELLGHTVVSFQIVIDFKKNYFTFKVIKHDLGLSERSFQGKK